MKLVFPPGVRNNAFDRNGSTKVNTAITGAVGPHGTTQRWVYTVPATKKYAIAFGSITIRQITAAGVFLVQQGYMGITPSGGAGTVAAAVMAPTSLNQGQAVLPISGGGYLMANDAIFFQTEDTNTGGTAIYEGSLAGTEFDA